MKKELIDKLMKKIKVESYLIKKTNSNSALIRSNNSNFIVVLSNPTHDLLNSILFYKTNYEKIIWVHNNKSLEKIANDVNSLTRKETIIPINIADI